MAIVNRKSGMVSGAIGDDVFFRARGAQGVRKMPDEIIAKNTKPWLEQKAVFGELAKIWRELPDEIKALWEVYAAGLGCASDVETNANVCYRYCPIPQYPPRPKNIEGVMAFNGANARAWGGGLDIPRLYPPSGFDAPPPPRIDARYERESGELVIGITTPTIINAEKADAVKALVWISISYGTEYIQHKRKLDSFDMPRLAGTRVEKRYAVIPYTTKFWGYKPFNFKDLPYVRVILGAQALVACDSRTAPEVSSGWFTGLWAFNDTRYLPYDELFQSGTLKNPGMVRFGGHFKKYVEKLKEKLAQKEVVVYKSKIQNPNWLP